MDPHPCIIKIHSKTESAALFLWLLLGIVHSTVTMVIWLTSDMLFKAGPMGFVVNSGAVSAVSGELFWFINSLERKVPRVALIWFYDWVHYIKEMKNNLWLHTYRQIYIVDIELK